MKALYTKQTSAVHPLMDNSHVAGEPIPNILLRNARKQNRWTQEDVAKKIQVGVASVGRWERGEVAPNRYARDMLCELFRRNAEELGFAGGQETPVSEEMRPPDQLSADSEDPGLIHGEIDKSNHRPFYEQLRYEREIRGWSQADLAEKVGSDTKSIGRWERGERIPRHYHRQALCEIFGKNAEELGLIELMAKSRAVPASRSVGVEARRLRTKRTLTIDWPVPCGDCERPEITVSLPTIVIDPSRDCTTFYFRATNITAENAGLRFV